MRRRHLDWSRRIAATILLAILTRGPVAATVDDNAQQGASPARPDGKDPSRRLSLGLSFLSFYDDNVLQLSDIDMERFRKNPDSPRFDIKSTDDTIAQGAISLEWRTRPLPRRDTTLDASATTYQYVRDDVKDFARYSAAVSQELTASRRHLATLEARASLTPHFYLRRLTDNDASFEAGRVIRRGVTYAETDYGLFYRQSIVRDRLEGRIGWEAQVRNYNDHFDERDGTKDILSASLKVRPAARSKITIRATYQGGDLEAEGDLASSPIPDEDISYRHHAFALESAFPWSRPAGGRIEVELQRETRDYTTDDPFDLCHFDRKDIRRDYRWRLVQRVSKKLELVAELRRRTTATTIPALVDPSNCTDETEFEQHRIMIGLTWHLDF